MIGGIEMFEAAGRDLEARKPQDSMPGGPEASRIDARRPGGLLGPPGLALVGPLAGWPAWLAGLAGWLGWKAARLWGPLRDGLEPL